MNLGDLGSPAFMTLAWTLAGLAGAALLWSLFRRRPAPAAASGALLLAVASWIWAHLPPPGEALWQQRLQSGWSSLVQGLQGDAEAASAGFGPVPEPGREGRVAAFDRIASLAAQARYAGRTLLLLDPDGQAVAWGGEGLLHELPELPADGGLGFARSLSAVTLIAAAPLKEAARPWRVVVGESYAADKLPFAVRDRLLGLHHRWTVGEQQAPNTANPGLAQPATEAAVGWIEALADGAPPMQAQRSASGSAEALARPNLLFRLAGAVLALALLLPLRLRPGRPRFGLRAPPGGNEVQTAQGQPAPARTAQTQATVSRATQPGDFSLSDTVPMPRSVESSGRAYGVAPQSLAMLPPHSALSLALAAWLLAWACGAEGIAALTHGLGAGLAAVGLVYGPTRLRSRRNSALLGLLASALCLLGSRWVQSSLGSYELGKGQGLASEISSHLGFGLAALGLLLLAAGREHSPVSRANGGWERWGWGALFLLASAAALHDFYWPALALLLSGGAVGSCWLAGGGFRSRPGRAFAALGLAALLAAGVREAAAREELRQRLGDFYLPALQVPSQEELAEIYAESHRFFNGLDLASRLPPVQGPVDTQDLAYVLWKTSPLAEQDSFSALVLEPYASSGNLAPEPSVFSFGLDLEDRASLSYRQESSQTGVVPGWDGAEILGETELVLAGQPWGLARYALVPRPGFRLAVSEAEEIEGKLLRGDAYRRDVDGLPRGVMLAFYDLEGRVRLSPWQEAPPLGLEAEERPRGIMPTPSGQSWYWAQTGPQLIEVVFLPLLHPLAGLERVAYHALATLGPLLLVALIGLLVALPRQSLQRFWHQAWRSYSKRLLLVYTTLLLVPLLALTLALLREFEHRTEAERQLAGRAGAETAQLLLSDFVRGLPPGFDLSTQVDQAVLDWVSNRVHYEVNLYWGSRLAVSSQQGLFTAGLLPKRIPGDIYSQVLLRERQQGVRQQRQGELSYLEVYAPLELPGLVGGDDRLVVSVPLLAEQEETAANLAALRRRAVLISSALFLLLLAVGSRLARRFTEPLAELVSGTERIANGARSLGVTPSELELSALAHAIDTMANRVAEGRQSLLREKQVVERMVANIASGILSLDREQRVLLHNRVAAQLLGTKVGEGLGQALSRQARLAPVLGLLQDARQDRAVRRTVRLRGDEGGEDSEYALTWVPIPGPDDPAALLVVDDVTEVLRGQRLEAWAEMARIIAHEIKNPLTPIRLSAEHLREVYREDPEGARELMERCTANILRQVEVLQETASEFSTYSHIPRAELELGDLAEALAELAEAYADASSRGVSVQFHGPVQPLPARFDRRLLGRAVRNLLENALRASGGEGEVHLALAVEGGHSAIRVADRGPGVEEANLGRIFEPYFSTHESGTGLGLAITQRIVEQHGGQISANNRPGGGLEVIITLPLVLADEALAAAGIEA